MATFTITTNKKLAEQIENFFKSEVLSSNRSIRLLGIDHHPGYSSVTVASKDPGARIDPADIFWLGFFSANT